MPYIMYEIKCINKEDRNNPWERITHIGGVHNGSNWKITQQEAIEGMKLNGRKFYVNINGYKVNIVVAKSRFGNEYIKTEKDSEEPNNLLSLRECR